MYAFYLATVQKFAMRICYMYKWSMVLHITRNRMMLYIHIVYTYHLLNNVRPTLHMHVKCQDHKYSNNLCLCKQLSQQLLLAARWTWMDFNLELLYSGKIWWFSEFVGNRQIKTSPIFKCARVALLRNAYVFVSPNLKFANMFWWVIHQN